MSDRNPPRVIASSGGRSIFYGGTELYNSRDPEGRAQARARALRGSESTLYLLASPLLWHGAAEILETIPDSSHVVAVELDDRLRSLAAEHLPHGLAADERLHFYRGAAHGHELLDFIRRLGVENFRSCELVSLNGGYRLHPREYGAIRDLVRAELESFWKNKMTLIHMAPLWWKNLFTNLALYHRHLHHFPDYGEAPVLVVGAGPSADRLREPLEYLRDQGLRERLRIIAVDTAYAPLAASGIIPDTVVAQEAQFYNVYDFLPVAHPHTDIPGMVARETGYNGDAGTGRQRNSAARSFFSFDLTSSQLVPRLGRAPEELEAGSCGFFLSRFFPARIFERLEGYGLSPRTVPPLGSVGSTAVELALESSSGPVYVCGLDFSFFYGKSHMRGSTIHLLELANSDRLTPVGSLPFLFPQQSVFPLRGKREEEGLPKRIRTGLLATYAAAFSDHFSGRRERLCTVEHEGAELGLRNIDADDFLERMAHCGEAAEGSSDGKEPGAEAVRCFLEQEAELLQRVYGEGSRRLSKGDEKESLEELVSEADYLLQHFPDTGYGPPKELDTTLIKRILVSAGHYSRIIEHALALLD